MPIVLQHRHHREKLWASEIAPSPARVLGSFSPLTPLRTAYGFSGPTEYTSTHGAFVANGHSVDLLDLRDKDVFHSIEAYPEAMAPYPLLLDQQGNNRAVDSKSWLASRNFIALDKSGNVVLGTTETGFFTIYRLGEFLKQSPLNISVVLNIDGGPI